MSEKKDFFVSYTSADKQWATWIAGTLEENEYKTIVQAWDFKTGGDFIKSMHDALVQCERVVVVLSEKYFNSEYCKSEFSSIIAKQLADEDKRIYCIPVRIEKIQPLGLAAPLSYIDLYGIGEKEATEKLLDGILSGDKPRIKPPFPGFVKIEKPRFPGTLPSNNLPHKRNPYFTGRVEKLESIYKNFQDKSSSVSLTQSIAGLGGVGKSSLALEYAYRYFNEYNVIWWINSETEQTALDDFAQFAVEKKLIQKGTEDENIILRTVRRWFNDNEKWLFIYDNADANDFDKWLEQYLPQSSTGDVIITTRNSFFPQSESINIDLFAEDEAAEFLKKRIKKDSGEFSDEWAKRLAHRLGYFPLALEQAAAYICVSPTVTYKSYISAVEKNLAKCKNLTHYDKTIYATLQTSIDKISKDSAARQMFNMCAYFAPERIPIYIFVKGEEVLPETFKTNISDIDDIVAELTKYSLLKCDDNRFLSMHRLVQEVVRKSFGDDTDWLGYCLDLMYEVIDWKKGGKEEIDTFKTESPHAIVISEKAEKDFVEDEEKSKKIGWIFNEIGYVYNDLGEHARAFEYHNKDLAICEKVYGEDHPFTAISYNNIGMVYDDLGEHGKALEYYNKSLAIREKVYGEDHPDTATSYNNIGAVYKALGEHARALEYFNKALAICEKVYGEDHPFTATSYNNIGMVYDDLGEHRKALEYYNKSLAIREKVYGEDHPDTATSYNNIGAVYKALGEHRRALEYYNKSLAIKIKVYGEDHPSTATSYNNIGYVYNALGEHARALEYFNKSLAIREKVYGEDHPDTATSYNNIGGVYDNLGEHGRALEYYNKSFAIFEKVYGEDHPSTITVRKNIQYLSSDKNYIFM